MKHGAQGLFGGGVGQPGVILHNGEPLRKGVLSLAQGDRAVLLTPSGGGFGDPLERDVERVVADVADGYVSLEQAREQYGVALDPETLAVDEA